MILAILILTLGCVSNAEPLAQSPSPASTGKFTGQILDANGAVVTVARIIVEAKGFKREVTTGIDGSYEFELPEGKYKIRVEHDWFYPFKKKNIRVGSNATTKLDITLNVRKRHDERHP
jgi:uncharacterized membrane protein